MGCNVGYAVIISNILLVHERQWKFGVSFHIKMAGEARLND